MQRARRQQRCIGLHRHVEHLSNLAEREHTDTATIVESECDGDPADYDRGTVGWVLANFRERKFPGLGIDEIRAKVTGADSLVRLLLAEVEQRPVR